MSKTWGGGRPTGQITHYGWKCKMMQTSGKPYTSGKQLSYDPPTAILNSQPRKMVT